MLRRTILKIMIPLLAILLIFTFPQKIHASSSDLCSAAESYPIPQHTNEPPQYHYLEFQEEEEYWRSKAVFCDGLPLSVEEMAGRVFKAFFEDGLAPSVPAGTKLLLATIDDGLLILNVSREIKNYGGTANEINLLRQIIKTAGDMPGLEEVSLFIEGKLDTLPEGSLPEAMRILSQKD